MPKPKHPPSNKDEVIERLIAENTQQNELLERLRVEIRLERSFEGCSLLGGLKAIIKDYHKKQDEVTLLKREVIKWKNTR